MSHQIQINICLEIGMYWSSSEPVNTDISQPNTSSTSSKNTAISEQNVIDPRNNDIGLFVNATNSTDIKDFESLVSFYIPEVDTVTANCELQIWKQKLKGLVTNINEMLPSNAGVEDPCSNALDAIRCCDPIIFPNIFMLLKILCCLPVSTSTPEKSFSGLKRIKTYLRNSMKEVCIMYKQ
ncbi:uncharacterized protein LOC132937949 [Metopolophium dirhodum]|uniref:uncharacterized protein LOC132937949 n=1 Tax=Metopolophium dirhodum TaxID=44670 RepID=UPI00299036EE|nr:uncharacterized protein LOC132937949 [Metopolophium dirhodum]